MDGMFHVFQLIPYISEKITVGSIAEFVSHTLKDHHDDTDYQIMNSGTNIADEIISSYPEINQWVIAGHSVGGTMAAQYAYNHRDVIDGLVIWASYPANTSDLSGTGKPVASISRPSQHEQIIQATLAILIEVAQK